MQIGSLIRRAALQFGDSPCLTEGSRTLSFKEFDLVTNRLGNALLARGLLPGDRIGVVLPNSLDCIVAYYAIAKAGLVRVQLNIRETLENHQYKLDDSEARAVIHADINELNADIKVGWSELQTMIDSGDDTPCAVDRDLDAPFRLAYTGGTTGKPKGVTLTTRGETVEYTAFLADLMPNLQHGETFLHASPIAHASGAFFLPALIRGLHSLVMTKFNPTEFLDLSEKSKSDYTFLVPTMIAMILEEPTIIDRSLNFKRIAYGASSIAPSLMRRAEEQFGRIFAQCYGQAESPMVITCLQPEDHDREGSCGRPFSVADVAILDDNDREVSPGERGEICVRGPQLMSHYWKRPEATAKAFKNGWLHTGDVGTMDSDGFFYIVDRKNDMLVSGGYNVYPREVEDVLLAFPGVVEAAVVGLPDERWGDRVVAAVAGSADLDLEALKDFAKENLANYKYPKAIEVWEELPKSGANKILRRSVRDEMLKNSKN